MNSLVRNFTKRLPLMSRNMIRQFSAIKKPVINLDSVSKVEQDLTKILKSEAKETVDDPEIEESIQSFLTESGWALSKDGKSTRVSLQKTVENTKVSVIFEARAPSAEEEENQEEQSEENEHDDRDMIEFWALLDKGVENKVLVQLMLTGGEINISRLTVTSRPEAILNAESESVYAYPGPEFETLDEELQHKISRYLRTFGIDDALGDAIRDISYNEENKLYRNFLEDFASVIKP